MSGEVVYAGFATEDDLVGVDLAGKIALIKRGDISFADKVLNAAKAGASAVIIYNNTSGALAGTLGGPNDAFVPTVSTFTS